MRNGDRDAGRTTPRAIGQRLKRAGRFRNRLAGFQFHDSLFTGRTRCDAPAKHCNVDTRGWPRSHTTPSTPGYQWGAAENEQRPGARKLSVETRPRRRTSYLHWRTEIFNLFGAEFSLRTKLIFISVRLRFIFLEVTRIV